jgi:hypothetical protein
LWPQIKGLLKFERDFNVLLHLMVEAGYGILKKVDSITTVQECKGTKTVVNKQITKNI